MSLQYIDHIKSRVRNTIKTEKHKTKIQKEKKKKEKNTEHDISASP